MSGEVVLDSVTESVHVPLRHLFRTNGDYSGGGVHMVARIGAIAKGEEIVVSADVLAESGKLPFPVSKPRSA